MKYIIEHGYGPMASYFSERAGRDFGAAGHGWVRSKDQATLFDTPREAGEYLERFLAMQAPDCTILPHCPPPAPPVTDADHYVTLELAPGAPAEEVKEAYRRLAMVHHPDRGGSEEDFKRVKRAYEALSEQTP